MSNGDWNDISSAPKTSERFQAWESLPEWPSPHGRVIRAWWQPFGDEIGWHDDLTRKPIIGQLTHWMPLPPPPTVTAAPTLGDRFDQQEKFAASQMKQTAASLETATREQTSQTTNHDAGEPKATSKKDLATPEIPTPRYREESAADKEARDHKTSRVTAINKRLADAGSEATPSPEIPMGEPVMDSTPAAPPSGEGPYKVEQGVSNHDGATVYSVVGPGGIERAEYMTRMMPDWWAVELNKAFAAGQATQSPRSERIEVAAKASALKSLEFASSVVRYGQLGPMLEHLHGETVDLAGELLESLAAALEQENT